MAKKTAAKRTRSAQQNAKKLQNLTNAGRGRVKGVPNKVTKEVRDLALNLVHNPGYQAKFARAFIARRINRKLEEMVWHYAFGKPKNDVNVSGQLTLAQLVNRVADGVK